MISRNKGVFDAFLLKSDLDLTTLLFDIDGTLVSAGGAGLKAINDVFVSMFGIESLPPVVAHGRTDQAILGDIFRHFQMDYEQHRDQFNRAYWERLPGVLQQSAGRVLPGVTELLPVLESLPHLNLGLLTGNGKRAAEIKLHHFQLDRHFKFGGFGDCHADRNDVAKAAMDSSKEFVQQGFDPSRVWVVGDTPNDIRCARSVGVKVLAVATGGFNVDELKSSKPDAVMEDLSDLAAVVDLIGD